MVESWSSPMRNASSGSPITISPGLVPRPAGQGEARRADTRLRALAVTGAVLIAFGAVGGQLVRLVARGHGAISVAMNEAVATSYARPDIADRNGRLIATDLETHSLYADPALVLDRDEMVEKLATVLGEFDEAALRQQLADRTRRFVWVRRGLTPATAKAVHDLGLPGLAFRRELRRAYPAGNIAGHLVGYVNIDNKGLAGMERHLDEAGRSEAVHGATLSEKAPVRLSIDLGVQHTLEDELRGAVQRYQAAGAAGVVLDVRSGEVLASASLPDVDPAHSATALDAARPDRVQGGTYELGSIFKTLTLAMALEDGQATLDTVLDVREPLTVGRFTIRDLHPLGRPLSLSEVFVHSSNVGAGMLALEAGAERQRSFLDSLGLLGQLRTETGLVAPPQVPARWDRAETITVSYGHGLAVAPLQFAAAAASLVNGGEWVAPTFLRRLPGDQITRTRVVKSETSARVRDLMRRNVVDAHGTGRRADAAGYEVGGKTGTAELPAKGGYKSNAVIASFLGAFPMREPRYVTLVMLFEPKPTADARNMVLAGANAAPTTGRLVARIAPLLGVLPDGTPAPLDDGEGVDAP